MSRHVRVMWPKCANIVMTRTHLRQDLGHLNPIVQRDGTSGAVIGLDIPDELASTDDAAGDYALRVLNDTLPPDYDASVLDVSLDSTVAADPEPVRELDAAPGDEEPSVLDVEEVPLTEDGEPKSQS